MGQNQRWLPHPSVTAGPKVGGIALLALAFSKVSRNRRQNQKWLPHRYLLGGPQVHRSAM